jgi:N6-adenosine-specific RNA methylase IME4
MTHKKGLAGCACEALVGETEKYDQPIISVSPLKPQGYQPLPRIPGGFRAVLADPPWKFKSTSAGKPGRNARRHYDCMTLAEIAALPVAEIVADNAACFLWVPGPLLVIGAHLPILKAWGFRPSAIGFTWAKTTRTGAFCCGNGLTTRKNAEFCVLGKRGRSVREHADVRELIVAARREHSRKPDEVFERIERYTSGPYLEMFARETRPGWVQWGDEQTKFDEADA